MRADWIRRMDRRRPLLPSRSEDKQEGLRVYFELNGSSWPISFHHRQLWVVCGLSNKGCTRPEAVLSEGHQKAIAARKLND